MSLDRLKHIGVDLDDLPDTSVVTDAVLILQVQDMDEDFPRTHLIHSDGMHAVTQLGMLHLALRRCEQRSSEGWEETE